MKKEPIWLIIVGILCIISGITQLSLITFVVGAVLTAIFVFLKMRNDKTDEDPERTSVTTTVTTTVTTPESNDVHRPTPNIRDFTMTVLNITDIRKLGRFPFVVIDTETTGLSAFSDDIIEVTAVKFDENGEIADTFSTLCKSYKKIPKVASDINGITDEMTDGKPYFSDIAPKLSEFIAGDIIVGHNLLFDVKFLVWGGTKIDFDNTYFIDTLRIAKKKIKREDIENYKLGTLAEHYGIDVGQLHRSEADAVATGKLLLAMLKKQ